MKDNWIVLNKAINKLKHARECIERVHSPESTDEYKTLARNYVLEASRLLEKELERQVYT